MNSNTSLVIKGSGKNILIPQPLITKVVVDKDANGGNFIFTLDFKFQRPLQKKNTSGISGVNEALNNTIKFAIIKFEVGNKSSVKLTKNLIKDLWGARFFPLASNLVSGMNIHDELTGATIKIMSLKEINDTYHPVVQNTRDQGKGLSFNVTDIQFKSMSDNPDHVSFCVMPYLDLQSIETNITTTKTKSLLLSQEIGVSNYKKRLNKHNNKKVLDLYKFDYLITLDKGIVIKDGFLFRRRDNNNIWTGETHITKDGNYRTGKFFNDHNLAEDERNIELKKVPLPCTKIHDRRVLSKTGGELSDTFAELFEVYRRKNPIAEIQKRAGLNLDLITYKPEFPNNFMHDFSCIDKDYNYNTIFTVDVSNLLLSKTRFPGILQSIMEDDERLASKIRKDILSLTSIKKCQIYRHPVTDFSVGGTNLTPNSAVLENVNRTTLNEDVTINNSPKFPTLVKEFDPGVGGAGFEIEDFDFQINNGLRVFTFKENFKDKMDAKFQYEAELLVDDGVYHYIRKLALKLRDLWIMFSDESTKVLDNNSIFWNSRAKQYNIFAIDKTYGVNYTDNHLKNVIRPLVETLEKVMRIAACRPINHIALKEAFIKATNYVSADPESLKSAYNAIEDIVASFMSLAGLNTNKSALNISDNGFGVPRIENTAVCYGVGILYPDATVAELVPTREIKNTFKHRESFESLLYIDKAAGYEYMLQQDNINSQGVQMVSEEDFKRRFTSEMSKYYDLTALQQTNKKTGPAFNIDQNKTRFFTPLMFALEDKKSVLPQEINSTTRRQMKSALLDILFYKQNSRQTNFNSERYINLLLELTGIDIEENTIAMQSNNTQTRSLTNVDLLSTRTGDFEEQDWKTSLVEQNVDLDNNARLRQYKTTQELANKDQIITNLILSSKVLSNKVSLGNSYEKTTSFLKRKIADINTPAQIINSLLTLVGDQALQSSERGSESSDSIISSLRKTDFSLSSLDVKLLDDYGLWWFNYDNIVELYYCKEYDSKTGFTWMPLTFDIYEEKVKNGKNLLCKFMQKTDPTLNQVNNEFLNLPIFNEYFVIKTSTAANDTFSRAQKDGNINFQTSLYNLVDMTNQYSSDFYQFVKTDVVSILGRPESKNVKALIKNKNTNIINIIQPIDRTNKINNF